jgi:HD-GYP domain-containing protein (c-di-GMP phosphodiesterase class II)
MFNKKDSNKNLYESKGKNNNNNNSNFKNNIIKGSPDSRIYTKRINYFNNYTENSGNRSNYEQLNDMNKNTNYSLVSEIKTNLIKDNDSIRRSLNNTEEKNFLINTINYDNDVKNSFEINNNDNRIIEKRIKGTKENFYKKLNLSKLKENRQKIRVNKLIKIPDKHLNIKI